MSGLGYSCNLFHFKNPIMSPWIEYLDSRKNQQSLSGHCWRIQIGLFRFEKIHPNAITFQNFVRYLYVLQPTTNWAALQAARQRIWNTIWARLWYPVIVSLGTCCMSFISLCVSLITVYRQGTNFSKGRNFWSEILFPLRDTNKKYVNLSKKVVAVWHRYKKKL